MPHLLHIESSPRRDRSVSIDVARSYVDAFVAAHPGSTVDRLDVWSEELPPFDGDALGAKYAALTGVERTPAQKQV